eukprot:695882-Pleurochrysis_carterae.AAC.1
MKLYAIRSTSVPDTAINALEDPFEKPRMDMIYSIACTHHKSFEHGALCCCHDVGLDDSMKGVDRISRRLATAQGLQREGISFLVVAAEQAIESSSSFPCFQELYRMSTCTAASTSSFRH